MVHCRAEKQSRCHAIRLPDNSTRFKNIYIFLGIHSPLNDVYFAKIMYRHIIMQLSRVNAINSKTKKDSLNILEFIKSEKAQIIQAQ